MVTAGSDVMVIWAKEKVLQVSLCELGFLCAVSSLNLFSSILSSCHSMSWFTCMFALCLLYRQPFVWVIVQFLLPVTWILIQLVLYSPVWLTNCCSSECCWKMSLIAVVVGENASQILLVSGVTTPINKMIATEVYIRKKTQTKKQQSYKKSWNVAFFLHTSLMTCLGGWPCAVSLEWLEGRAEDKTPARSFWLPEKHSGCFLPAALLA